jgi:hypothetical protein
MENILAYDSYENILIIQFSKTVSTGLIRNQQINPSGRVIRLCW